MESSISGWVLTLCGRTSIVGCRKLKQCHSDHPIPVTLMQCRRSSNHTSRSSSSQIICAHDVGDIAIAAAYVLEVVRIPSLRMRPGPRSGVRAYLPIRVPLREMNACLVACSMPAPRPVIIRTKGCEYKTDEMHKQGLSALIQSRHLPPHHISQNSPKI